MLRLQAETPDTTFDRFVRGLPTVEPPVPDPVASVFAAIFNAPTWAWVVAIAIGVIGGGLLLRTAWTRRLALRDWFVSRDRGAKALLLGSFGAIFLFVAVTGTASWNYMQHDNDFCSSCHVMEGPWNKFARDAGKHSVLKCHDCHQQSIIASSRELMLWVANKPEEIPTHSPVPNARCESCHNTQQDEMWTRVAETAGHRTHMESDSSALAEVQCVTCHGAEVHAFVPASRTCGQSGCHETLEIKLGKMAEQTALHCNMCHQFTAEVPRLATRDCDRDRENRQRIF
jgi:nitrate/TMAO reductase-like tetraheme cytochrome c subunit